MRDHHFGCEGGRADQTNYFSGSRSDRRGQQRGSSNNDLHGELHPAVLSRQHWCPAMKTVLMAILRLSLIVETGRIPAGHLSAFLAVANETY
jgi:hypothetical protein